MASPPIPEERGESESALERGRKRERARQRWPFKMIAMSPKGLASVRRQFFREQTAQRVLSNKASPQLFSAHRVISETLRTLVFFLLSFSSLFRQVISPLFFISVVLPYRLLLCVLFHFFSVLLRFPVLTLISIQKVSENLPLPSEWPCPWIQTQTQQLGLVERVWEVALCVNNTIDIKMICFVLLLANDERGLRRNSKKVVLNGRAILKKCDACCQHFLWENNESNAIFWHLHFVWMKMIQTEMMNNTLEVLCATLRILTLHQTVLVKRCYSDGVLFG